MSQVPWVSTAEDVDAVHARPESPAESYEQALRSELERRISALATQTESPPLGVFDLLIALAVFVFLPLLLVWVLR
jgi:hypothetical protein